MHDFYKERGLEVPKPGKFGWVLFLIHRLKNKTVEVLSSFLFCDKVDWWRPLRGGEVSSQLRLHQRSQGSEDR